MLIMLCPSCFSSLLALLFTRMLFPFLILQTPSKLSSNILLQKAFSESPCLSLGSRARISKFRWHLKLIPLLFLACQVAGSSSLSNSPEEQDALVTNLCRLLISQNSSLLCSQLEGPSLNKYEEYFRGRIPLFVLFHCGWPWHITPCDKMRTQRIKWFC